MSTLLLIAGNSILGALTFLALVVWLKYMPERESGVAPSATAPNGTSAIGDRPGGLVAPAAQSGELQLPGGM